jgi:cytochrome bd-type quinol oxidase subunit 1
LTASFLQLYPLGDTEGRLVARHQPVTLAAMEALWETQPGAPLVILGQPNEAERKIDNPIVIPNALSFLTWHSWHAEVQGLNHVPQEDWPDNVPLLYYVYHIMVGLGTLFIAISAIACFLLWRKQLYNSRWMLWILLLAAPFPYIANTAGWMTAEFGRQPWLVYGLLRTGDGYSKLVTAGNGWFSFLGFCGMYAVLGILFYRYFAHSRSDDRGAFRASCAYIVGMLVGAAFALYPNVLPASTGQQYSLTIYNAATGAHGMVIGFVWWTLGMILAVGYFVFIYRMFRGKVNLREGGESGY